ncbi:MAG: ABC transporter ATP-binding protein, partial [Holosporales bacterium]
AIAMSPSFLFLDEPTAGLDPLFSRLIGDLIQECRRSLGATTLTITHDLSLAHKIADRIGMIHEGKIIWQGTAQDLSNASHPIVQEFVGG